MKLTNQTYKLIETIFFAQRASKRKRLSFSVLLVLGLGTLAYLTGCEVTVREPGVVVTPPTVAVEAPPVVVETPPVVLEEGVGVGGAVFVAPPIGVEYVLIGGRYAYFHPEFHRWYYRPMAWRPPAGYRAREVRSLGELERIHRSEVRREGPRRPDVRREEPRRPDVRREEPRRPDVRPQETRKPEVRREEPKKAQKKEEPKKKEKKEKDEK